MKFALMIMSVGAEGLDMMRIKDPKICSINQSADEVSAMSAKEKQLLCGQVAARFLMRPDRAHAGGVFTGAETTRFSGLGSV